MIVFAHLLNDRSGSPQVLSQVIDAIGNAQDGSCLYVGSDGRGVLEDGALPIRRYWYWRAPWRLLTLVTYSLSQLFLFLQLLFDRSIRKDAVIYVNTLLPFGAALYGRLTGRRVIYHLHEVSVSPAPLRWWLVWLARVTASELLYVSQFHRQCLPIAGVPFRVMPNAVSEVFFHQARSSEYQPRRKGCFTVLMLASLRDYKGVPEFIALAECFAERDDMQFELIANDDDTAIARYFRQRLLPLNLTLQGRTPNPAGSYARASLVLNLSRPDQWLETFGLTLVEAMAFGIPVIAPPVGGPVEFIEDGREGYLIDCRNGEELAAKVEELASDEELCQRLSIAARERAAQFTPDAFASAIRAVLGPQKENE